jgi:cytidylate kinase
MGIITISRGSYSNCVEIAQKLSEKLGYDCITREDLLKTSDEFNIPEIKLTEDIDNAFSVFDNIKGGRKYYSAFIREAFLERIKKDNVIYDGFVGQYFAKGIPNILKVRIISDIDRRIKIMMEKKNIDEDSARERLQKIDSERRKWSMSLYCVDSCISELYDVILHIKNLTPDNAVDILSDFAKESCFKSTPESMSRITEMLSAAKEYTKTQFDSAS